ncbi:hypothetical protein SKAU_G00213870 [Synaphobranchus kaupii]|uniref:Uncharacterized protein n=1 Tax=Synaphobranchus kaupii TaxID=118154 RepID=A0A9Q1IT67_SYNKA|nr:hypothetical protein SKAU_G00213870 [Synaphobranchus kaupii]
MSDKAGSYVCWNGKHSCCFSNKGDYGGGRPGAPTIIAWPRYTEGPCSRGTTLLTSQSRAWETGTTDRCFLAQVSALPPTSPLQLKSNQKRTFLTTEEQNKHLACSAVSVPTPVLSAVTNTLDSCHCLAHG